jgi:hypothetical protein
LKWGKDHNIRTIFGVWLDERNIYQTEVAKACDLADSLISVLCNDHTFKPSYLIYRKLRSGLEALGYPGIKYDDFWS